MKKELKKSYMLLDLPFDASEDAVIARKTALIKIYNSGEKTDKNKESKIKNVEEASSIIIDNLKRNGVPQHPNIFESSNQSIIGLIIVFCFVAMVCYFSFMLFL